MNPSHIRHSLLVSMLLGFSTCLVAQDPSSQTQSSTKDRIGNLKKGIAGDRQKIAKLQQAADSVGGADVERINKELITAIETEIRTKERQRANLDCISQVEEYLTKVSSVLSHEQSEQVKKRIEDLKTSGSSCEDSSNSADNLATHLVLENKDAGEDPKKKKDPTTGTDSQKKSRPSGEAGEPPHSQRLGGGTELPAGTAAKGAHDDRTQSSQAPPQASSNPGASASPNHEGESQPQETPSNANASSSNSNGNSQQNVHGASNSSSCPQENESAGANSAVTICGKVYSRTSGNPLNGVIVEIKSKDGKELVGTTLTDLNGGYQLKIMQKVTQVGEYRLAVNCDCNLYKPIVTEEFSVSGNTLDIPDLYMEELPTALRPQSFGGQNRTLASRLAGGELARVIAGFEQSGASASTSHQNFFYDMFISVPFPAVQSVNPLFGPKFRVWGDVRISSAPQNFSQPVGTFVASFADNIGNTEVRNLARSADWISGLEYGLISLPSLLPSFDGKTKQKFSLSLLAEAGAITPLDPKDNISVFYASPEAISRFGLPADTQFVAFTSQDRNRFFRQYSAGFRLKTHYFDLVDRPLYRFPAYLDVTYGVDESVTRGRIRGGVLKIDGFYPLPWDNVKYIYFYGTAKMKPARAKIDAPLILREAPQDTLVPGEGVAIVPLPQIDRDYYRLGVGVDFISLFKTIVDNKNKQDKKTNQ